MFFSANGPQSCTKTIAGYPGEKLFLIDDFGGESWSYLRAGLKRGGTVIAFALVDDSFCTPPDPSKT